MQTFEMTDSVLMPPTLTVTAINRQVRLLLEEKIDEVFVLGELSNFIKASSGHLYFTLKDEKAQLRCAFFRSARVVDTNAFQNGQQVIARGRLSLYEPRGDYQLIVQELTLAGLGALYQQFEELKKILQVQGLFDTDRKKILPRFPEKIGIITSLSGAAMHDITTTLKRRYPLASLLIYPSEVQGKNASQLLIKAINRAQKDEQADVLILARGGGSIEDLWAFNDEKLAYAISACTIPIVSGVGHETDITIADFVADLRAATPTAAAEAVTPNKNDLLARIHLLAERLNLLIRAKLRQSQVHFSHCQARLSSPKQLILARAQTLDYLEKQAKNAIEQRLQHSKHRYHLIAARLIALNPNLMIKQYQEYVLQNQQQLTFLLSQKIKSLKQNFLCVTATLAALNPLSTLERGFAIASANGHILYDAKQILVNAKINLRLARGELECRVLAHKALNE